MDTDTRLDDLEAAVRWIHADAGTAELELLVAEASQRFSASERKHKISLTPVTTWHDGQRMAGSYFKLLSGNVATLGGARAEPGWEQAATDLIIRQIDRFSGLGLPQIQAIVRADDVPTAELVQRAGMTLLSEIEHLWLDVLASYSLAASASSEATSWQSARESSQPGAMRWWPANVLDDFSLAQFIDKTFVDTLDCPALNGRRTPEEVLAGFLDGRSPRDPSLQWELLNVADEFVGCLLLQAHDNALMELVYMGLVPEARGRGLGKAMVARAIQAAHRSACSTLVVAVDRDNWPALNVYCDWGFQPHQRLQVWVVPS